jgi:hypothetical protein
MFGNEPSYAVSSFVTPLTDISANILAMMILILIAALAGQQRLNDAVGTEEDFSIDERTPMTASGVLQHLYDRRSASSAIRFDLQENDVTFFASDGTVHKMGDRDVKQELPRYLLDAGGGAVRLYVFSHNLYPRLIASLRMTGRSWQEISVPQALRASGNTGWSDEFAALLERPVDRETFVEALARLLSSKRSQASSGDRTAANMPFRHFDKASISLQNQILTERIANWWGKSIPMIAVFIALVIIVWVEWRTVS